MYGTFAGHPLLEVVVLLASGWLGFKFVTDPHGPLTNQPPLTRFVVLVIVATIAHTLFATVASLFSPLVNGASTASSILQALGGLVLTVGLIGSYFVLKGDVHISLPLDGATFREPRSGAGVSPGASAGFSAGRARCRECEGELRTDAKFCNGCGVPVSTVS